ncbi:alpha/beta fold hydrolase [Radicibacter daui]|uniref:alpha/beta fold hydrolase n=1 Tax=Radicibacter daui TaxID=3064829 RepID=UPI004046BB3B
MPGMIARAILLAGFLGVVPMLSATAQKLSAPAGTISEGAGMAGRFSVETIGSGCEVILIPGLASSREVWRELAASLQQTHRVHLVQVAGFAGEPAGANASGPVAAPAADALADWIAHEGLKAPAVIGHSLGGAMALMLAARHPGSASRVMVVDSLPFFGLRIDPSATVENMKPRAEAFRTAMLAASEEQRTETQATTLAGMIKQTAARPAVIAAALRSDRNTVANATYELMTTDLRPELGQITVPVTVVYAWDASYGFPGAAMDQVISHVYAGLPQVRFERIDDSLHFIMLDQPQRLTASVLAFLGG